MKLYCKNKTDKTWLVYLVMFVITVMSASVMALGIGVIKVNSFIGQPLDSDVPLLNVTDMTKLSAEFDSNDEETQRLVSRLNLSLTVSELANRPSIKIRSEKAVAEPYLNFTLVFNYQGARTSKQFSALLDLAPVAVNQGDTVSSLTFDDPQRVQSQNNLDFNGGLMGPYDWATASSLPSRFGPVLDGQSLWRVARRMNQAFGVTINQMMWALYVTNPDAFSSKSMASLKAGSYLDVPSFAVASRVTDQEALEKINQLAGSQSNRQIVLQQSQEAQTEQIIGETEEVTQVEEETELPVDDEEAKEPASVDSFKILAADQELEAESEETIEAAATKDENRQVITSLATTVGNLTQELINKDKRIQFLEEKVEALEALQAIKSESQPSILTPESDIVAVTAPVNEVSEVVDSASDSVSTSETIDIQSEKKSGSWFWWGFLAFILLLCGVVYFLWERLVELWNSLNLFGEDEDVEFAPTTVEYINGEKAATSARNVNDRDFSTLSAVQQEIKKGTVNIHEDFNDLEYEIQEFNNAMDVEISDLEFEDRFNHLIADKDYDFAKELLDFAKNNEIDEQEYAYYRLKLYEVMKDEQGFYDYYYKIESGLPHYEVDVQAKISELVVAIGNH